MSAQEFQAWHRVWAETKDEDVSELAWRGMNACVDWAETHPGDIEDAAYQLGKGVAWAAFWVAVAAVVCVAIIKG